MKVRDGFYALLATVTLSFCTNLIVSHFADYAESGLVGEIRRSLVFGADKVFAFNKKHGLAGDDILTLYQMKKSDNAFLQKLIDENCGYDNSRWNKSLGEVMWKMKTAEPTLYKKHASALEKFLELSNSHFIEQKDESGRNFDIPQAGYLINLEDNTILFMQLTRW
jgi:hypothetical protein